MTRSSILVRFLTELRASIGVTRLLLKLLVLMRSWVKLHNIEHVIHFMIGDFLMAHRCSPADSLPVVVGRVGPPVCLGLDITQDHVLNGDGETWHLRGRRHSSSLTHFQHAPHVTSFTQVMKLRV